LLGCEAFDDGRIGGAVGYLGEANKRGRYDAFTMAFATASKEAYLSGEFPPLQAEVAGLLGTSLPHLQSLARLARETSSPPVGRFRKVLRCI
jgi:hypothetical protein